MNASQSFIRRVQQFASWVTWFMCAMQGILAVLHLYPPLAYRQTDATTTRLVAYVNSLGYIWVIALGLTAILLALSQVYYRQNPRWRSKAHLLCSAVAFGYDIQLWVGALGEKPFGPVVYPVSFIVIVAIHYILFLYYDGGER